MSKLGKAYVLPNATESGAKCRFPSARAIRRKQERAARKHARKKANEQKTI